MWVFLVDRDPLSLYYYERVEVWEGGLLVTIASSLAQSKHLNPKFEVSIDGTFYYVNFARSCEMF
jgi:hypothetical protein